MVSALFYKFCKRTMQIRNKINHGQKKNCPDKSALKKIDNIISTLLNTL